MTTNQARGIKQDGLNDVSVAEYLQTYPDFFERNGPLPAGLFAAWLEGLAQPDPAGRGVWALRFYRR